MCGHHENTWAGNAERGPMGTLASVGGQVWGRGITSPGGVPACFVSLGEF